MRFSRHCRAGVVPLWAIFALLLSAMSPAMAQSRVRVPAVTGCWEASRPLGPTGGALAVPRDAPYTTIVLRDSGRVVLPRLGARERASWGARSYWQLRGDSVELTVFTGLQGWNARLAVRDLPRSMAGHATYLTDAVVANMAPMRAAVTLARTSCEPEWSALPITTRLPRSWERGEPMYFESQVERPAALAAGARLPNGVLSMRPLGRDEMSNAVPERPEVVVVQFVVLSNGRADTTALKVLYAQRERVLAAVQDELASLLSTVRFAPAMVGGQAVHQLAAWRIERVLRH